MGEGMGIKVKWEVLPLCTTLQTKMPVASNKGSPRAPGSNPLGCTQLRRPLPWGASQQSAAGKGVFPYTGVLV